MYDMSFNSRGSEISSSSMSTTRSLSEISETETIRLGLDLVSAARRNVRFLRAVDDSQWLHQKPVVIEAIRRSKLASFSSNAIRRWLLWDVNQMLGFFLLQVSYRKYCEAKFSKLIGKPTIFDEENEEYALMRCREIWVRRYPNDPFENEDDSGSTNPVSVNQELLLEVTKHRFLYSKFSEPYRSEIVYLIAARQRYKGFLYMLKRSTDVCSPLVPASDILLMWLTHQSYPTIYAEDSKEVEGDLEKVVPIRGTATKKEVEETKNLWERTFDQPYEKAGGGIVLESEVTSVKPPVYWDVSDTDFNSKYKSTHPRFLLEVCVFVRLRAKMKAMQEQVKRDNLRLRVVRCHRELKLDKTVSSFSYTSWQKAWHLYCEFGTKGIIFELRRHGGGYCFKGSSLQDTVTFHWNDLLRAPSLTLEREVDQQVKIITSITPPAQAPYLLKCVPDRVTDDSGAMISDVILKMNQYRPQEGRWLSRTVLDHAGRECFVVRIRVGEGFWRRGGEIPSIVKWEDRIIEIREGSWSYVAGSIGRAPERVVGTATPKEPPEQWKAAWYFSTGDELLLRWGSSISMSGLGFCLRSQATESTAKLLTGRRMQYRMRKDKSEYYNERSRNEEEVTEEDDEEEGFVTLVRFTEDDPDGRATALLNWKLLAVEFLPEEDAVFVLLLCISMLRSISDMKKEDVGGLLIRRRLKEAKIGTRDWGSVVLHPSSSSLSISSPYLQPWYWNAKAVMASDSAADHITKQPAFTYSPEEGGDKLYKRGIFTQNLVWF
nr:uncharacterized protein LOC107411832 isoform X3 [Ziziphus jujuba var. spinosa]